MDDFRDLDRRLHRRAFLSTAGALVVGLAAPEVWAQAAPRSAAFTMLAR